MSKQKRPHTHLQSRRRRCAPMWSADTHRHAHSCTCCQSDPFASADSPTRRSLLPFLLFPFTHTRLISYSTLYLSHLSSFVLISFIISAVNTSAQCEVAALKEFHSSVRCAHFKNVTYCHIEWQIKWKWHRVLINCLFFLKPGNIWQSC